MVVDTVWTSKQTLTRSVFQQTVHRLKPEFPLPSLFVLLFVFILFVIYFFNQSHDFSFIFCCTVFYSRQSIDLNPIFPYPRYLFFHLFLFIIYFIRYLLIYLFKVTIFRLFSAVLYFMVSFPRRKLYHRFYKDSSTINSPLKPIF